MVAESPFNPLRILSRFLKVIRWIVVLGMGTLVLVFGADFLLNTVFNPRRLEGFAVIKLIRSTTEPVVTGLTNILSFTTKVQLRFKPAIRLRFKPKSHGGELVSPSLEIELMPLIIAMAFYLTMRFLSRQAQQLSALVEAEYHLRLIKARRAENKSVEGLTFSSTATDSGSRGFWGQILRRKEAERDRLLREFVVAKKRLDKVKQQLAFLSVDMVGSTRIKLSEDPLYAEHAFREYRYFLEQIFKRYRYRAASWTPDGVMVCFPQLDLACGAAKEILRRLPSFNEEKNPLDMPIQVRSQCG